MEYPPLYSVSTTYRKSNLILLLLFFTLQLNSQSLSLEVTKQDAVCGNNGSIVATATGGSGDYIYELSGDCIQPLPPQQNGNFTNLSACSYTINVIDQQTNESISKTVMISGDYQTMQVTTEVIGCDLEIEVTGGGAPYQYSFGYEEDALQLNNPPTSNLIQMPESGTIYIEVVDNCNRQTRYQTFFTADAVSGFRQNDLPNQQIKIIPRGGTPPYQITILNGNETVAVDSETNTFSLTDLTCESRILIEDACSSFEDDVELSPEGHLECVNFSAGTATVNIEQGVPPFTVEARTPEGTITSTDGVFTDLPINVAYYKFFLIDACGNEEEVDDLSRYKPRFSTASSCANDTIEFYITRNCSGPFNYPMQARCLNCEPVQEVMIESSSTNDITFSGYSVGEWEIEFSDDCGDTVNCTDRLELEVQPACDSVIATVINRFTCDNRTSTRRVIDNPDIVFTIFDEADGLLATNQHGTFSSLTEGTYRISAVTDCDTLWRETTIRPPIDTDPNFAVSVASVTRNDSCQILYSFRVEQNQGPFVLQGTDNDYYRVLNDFGEDNCRYYRASGLIPGSYTLISMNRCGVLEIELPNPDFALEAVVKEVCPGAGQVEVSLGRTFADWRAYFADYNLRVLWDDYEGDDYYALGNTERMADEAAVTFSNITPTDYTVGLIPFSEYGCPIITTEITVPEYEPLTIETQTLPPCDGEVNGKSVINISGGEFPFTVAQNDCTDEDAINEISSDSLREIIIDDLALGSHCFTVADGCDITSNFGTTISAFTDSITYEFACDETVSMRVDTLTADYEWTNSLGEPLGTSNRLTQPVPSETTEFNVTVDLAGCTYERQVTIEPIQLIPNIQIITDRSALILCGTTDSIRLTAIGDTENIRWQGGSTQLDTVVNTGGEYQLTAVSDYSCEQTATIRLVSSPLPQPNIVEDRSDCATNEFHLTATDGFTNYQWSTAEEGSKITATEFGTYYVTVTDENNCSGTDSITIASLTAEWLSFPPLCPDLADGSIGIENVQYGKPPFRWTMTGDTYYQVPYELTDLAPGDYQLTLIDAFGCETDTTIIFSEPVVHTLDIGDDLTISLGDTINLSPRYSQSTINEFNSLGEQILAINSTDLSATLQPYENGQYTLVTYDENQCELRDSINITVDKTIKVYQPNAFTPNGDNNNDYFRIFPRPGSISKVHAFRVFNRWGNLVFEELDKPIAAFSQGWDGSYAGEDLNTGIFIWTADLEFINGRREIIRGEVNLQR